jgi:prephenate dehydrogenase
MRPKALAVIGPGLLGGSLLFDARRLGWPDVRAYVRREAAAEHIRQQHLATTATTDLPTALRGADVIVLATPVGTYRSLAEQIVAHKGILAQQVLITDIGSVKEMVLAGAGEVFSRAGLAFVGAHPMAGGHEKGVHAAKAGLFQEAACILTPRQGENEKTPAIQQAIAFWQALGCRTALLDARTHDTTVAHISHMPHLAAVAVTLAALAKDPSLAEYAAGGLRDTTRVAAGDPPMWREILTENRSAVLQSAQELKNQIEHLIGCLQSHDDEKLQNLLEKAKSLRDARYSP